MIILSIFLIILSGICKAIVDTISHHYDESIFSKLNPFYWNPDISWKNKYKNKESGKESFFLSKTLLVSLTDAWHLFGLLERIFIFLSVFLIGKLYLLALLYGTFTTSFHIFYTYIFKLKTK